MTHNPPGTTSVLTLLCLSLTSVHSVMIRQSDFKSHPLCSVQEKIFSGCMASALSQSRSRVDCVKVCAADSSCHGVSQTSVDPGSCFTHLQCGIDVNNTACTELTKDQDYSFFYKTATRDSFLECFNGGTWDAGTDSCVCVRNFVGTQCERRASNCYEYYTQGYASSSKFWADLVIDVDGLSTDLQVLCYHDEGRTYYKMYVLVNDGNYDFNKTMAEYTVGFVRSDDRLWLGLDNILLLNRAGFRTLSFYVVTTTGGRYEVRYSDFQMALEGGSYVIKNLTKTEIRIRQGDPVAIGDCLTPLINRAFSAWDSGGGDSCGASAGVGWWFPPDCQVACNPLGLDIDNLPLPQTPQHWTVAGIDFQELTKILVYFEVDI